MIDPAPVRLTSTPVLNDGSRRMTVPHPGAVSVTFGFAHVIPAVSV